MSMIDEERFREIDEEITAWLRTHGLTLLRYGLAVVFIWFGALKPLGLSSAEGLVLQTLPWFPPDLTLLVLGLWEIAIGVSFLYRPLIRIGLPLLGLHMLGTFSTIVLVPGAIFAGSPWVLTLEGQYVVKNIVLIGAAMVVGGFVVPAEKEFD